MGEYNFCLLDVDYIIIDEKPVIRMFGRTDKGESVVAFDRTFEPYFYIESENPEECKKKLEIHEPNDYTIKKTKLTEKILLGKKKKMVKVFTKKPGDVPKARRDVKNIDPVKEVYEAHILFNRRYLFDKGLQPMTMIKVNGKITNDVRLKKDTKADKFIEIEGNPKSTEKPIPKLKVMAFDIEVYNPKGAPRPKKDEIIMLSLKSGAEEKVISTKTVDKFSDKIIKVDSELDIIKKFEEIVEKEDIDILVGYNTDQFDLPYIRDRAEKHKHTFKLGRTNDKIKFKTKGMFAAAEIKGRVHVDLFHYVSYILRGALGSVSKRTLSNVAHVFLDKGEEKGDIDWRDMPEYWNSDGKKLETFFEYSLNDAVITKQLSDIFTPKIYEIAKLVKVPLFDANRTSYGQLVENYLIWNAHEKGEVVPNRPKEAERESRYKNGSITGAYVHEPEKGMHEDIALLDFRSLYPTIIISHNIDPGTIDCSCCRETAERIGDTGHWFCDKRKGLIPTVLNDILNKRIKIKEKMKKLDKGSQEYSELDNEQYALKILANSAYGYLAYRNARWYTREGAECVTYLGRMYIKKIMKIAEKKGLDVIYGDTDSLFVTTKEGKIKEKLPEFMEKVKPVLPGVMELELEGIFRRGIFVSKKRYALIDDTDTMKIKGLEFVRKDWSPLAKETQKNVLQALLKDGSADRAFEIVRKVIKKIKSGDVKKEDLAVYTELTRPLDKYKVTAPHIAVGERMKRKGKKVTTGTTVGYIIMRNGGKNISSRARSVEEAQLKKYDKNYYIKKQIIPAVSRVMEALGYGEDELLGKKQETLEEYFQ
ncbi:MAG: DNA-directed DNA polymerase [Candidatus Undinarchaeales archaeon]